MMNSRWMSSAVTRSGIPWMKCVPLRPARTILMMKGTAPDFPKLFQGLMLELLHVQPCAGVNPFMNHMLSRATCCLILQELASLGTTDGLKAHELSNVSFNVWPLLFLVFQCHCYT